VLAAGAAVICGQSSEWVKMTSGGRLEYRTTARGDRIMDFSFAGYGGGGVAIPTVPAAQTLKPEPGDNSARIQAAIDAASASGGAVVLEPGSYDVERTVTIAASGVVLRGSGSGEGGTTIRLTGKPHRFLAIRGAGAWEAAGNSAAITDVYVPSGADSFHVGEAARFHVGDTVLVRRPVTEAWVHFMGMDTLVRDGKPQTWIKAGTFIRTDRTIRAIDGDRITLDVPLSDSIDLKYLNSPGASLVAYTFPGRISKVGLEHLRIESPVLDVPISEGQYTAFQIDAAIDAWARDIAIQETQNGIVIGPAAKRVTLDQVRVAHTASHTGSAAPADFSLSGTQVLVSRCGVKGEGTWPVVTQATVTGPIVVLDFESNERGVSPHQRWATGLLVDRSTFTGSTERAPGIAFSNRKTAGSGHGWDVGWAVAWNVRSAFLQIEQPPGAINWCIGCTGKPVRSDGTIDSLNQEVQPGSLYLAQLRERLGQAGLRAIGYTSR
jgi:hypothetical protein